MWHQSWGGLVNGKLTVDSMLPGDAPCRLEPGKTELYHLGSAPHLVVARPLAPHLGRATEEPGVTAGQHTLHPHLQVSDRPASCCGRGRQVPAGMQASLLPTLSR